MKLPFCSALALPLLLVACSSLDPEYAEYKKQKEAEAAQQKPFGPGTDPYAGANPYGVPGASETGAYKPAGAPLQPLPSLGGGTPSPDPINPPGSFTPRPSPSPYPAIPSPTGTATSHVVAKGDSLWALARRYETTVEAIQSANGITGSSIQVGQTLQIPR